MVVRNLDLEHEMSGDQRFTRIDLVDIKIQIVKKIGNQKSEKYFGLLNRFFSLKLHKSEFNKLCVAVIGQENVYLHNQLIRSILKNAVHSQTPPPKRNSIEKHDNDKAPNGYKRSCLQTLSAKKGRTPGFRDRKGKDRLSPLGPHGKPNAIAVSKDLGRKTLEQQSATELLSLGSMPVEVMSVEDGEEVNQAAISPGIYSRSPVAAPYGIPWNVKGAHKGLRSMPFTSNAITCHGKGYLLDTNSLLKRLETNTEKEGMRVSVDCMNLLNNGLDSFLKHLIKPSIELARSRVGTGGQSQVTMRDFRTAMELDPQILGKDGPVQLEKVCVREYENGDRD